MADEEKKPKQDDLMNPSNMAGARRLLANPKAFDEAMESGLGKARPDPTYDDTRRKR